MARLHALRRGAASAQSVAALGLLLLPTVVRRWPEATTALPRSRAAVAAAAAAAADGQAELQLRRRRSALLLPLAAPLVPAAWGGPALAEDVLQPPTWIPDVGDQLKAKPGVEFTNKQGEEVYVPGDFGYVRRIIREGSGENKTRRLEIYWARTKKLSSISLEKWPKLYVGIVSAEASRVRRPAEGAAPIYSFEVPPGFSKMRESVPEVAKYRRNDGATISVFPLGLPGGPGVDVIKGISDDMKERIRTGIATFGTQAGYKSEILKLEFGDREDRMETTEPITPDDGVSPSWVKKQFHRWLLTLKSPSISLLMVIEVPEDRVSLEFAAVQSTLRSLRLEGVR